MCPRPPTSDRSRPSDVGGSTYKKAARFEGRHDCDAKGKGSRLDFRLVLTRLVCVRITTDLGERLLPTELFWNPCLGSRRRIPKRVYEGGCGVSQSAAMPS